MKHYGKSVSLFVLEVLSLALLQGWLRCVGLPPVGASRHDAAGGCCSDAVGGLAAWPQPVSETLLKAAAPLHM